MIKSVGEESSTGVEKEKGKKMRYGKIRIEDGFLCLPDI